MLQEVRTIRRWDELEPVAGATWDWSGREAVELGEESGGGEGRGSRGRLELKAADEEPREPQTKGPETAGIVAVCMYVCMYVCVYVCMSVTTLKK